ncbi:MAG: Lrp/AsnC family transcriptional regulator [Candidatus Bathyarchaeota archaeon]|nr:Lrp/AsnC family transcriptional regulator [Candidatus Bathyarchaeota archaeon]
MKERMRRLLWELLKDSKRSDRELAKVLGVSQPTITRLRHKLVDEGIIQGFTVIPEFTKLGYEIMAITLAKAKSSLRPDEQEKSEKLVLTNPSVIFVASGEGMGMNGVMISLHRNYADYVNFMQNLRSASMGHMEKADSMLVSLKPSAVIKPLSPAYLAEGEEI